MNLVTCEYAHVTIWVCHRQRRVPVDLPACRGPARYVTHDNRGVFTRRSSRAVACGSACRGAVAVGHRLGCR